MEAAITARQRGFDVQLWEKSDRLGGTLWAAGGPDFKADVLKLIKSLETQCEKLGVDVQLGKEATPEALADVKVDKIILAAGSTPAMPPIPGIETATLACDYLTHQAQAGKNVVVIGGGLAGTEAACDIAPKAESVTIVEMLPDILATANHCLNNDQHLRKMVGEFGINVAAGAKVTKICADSVTYEKDGESVTIPCDTVLNAAGFKAADQLEDACLAVCEDVAVIGDAIAPRKILDAVHEGYHAIRIME
jgi:2-enoate reductase